MAQGWTMNNGLVTVSQWVDIATRQYIPASSNVCKNIAFSGIIAGGKNWKLETAKIQLTGDDNIVVSDFER